MEVIGLGIRRKTPCAQDDYHLVQTAVAGNQDAYAALLGRYRKSVFQFMLQKVKNSAEAEDLTMEAFEKAFFNLSSYAPTHAFSTWLFKIALNNCIDHNRKKRLPVLFADGLPVAGFDSEALKNAYSEVISPEEAMIRKQRLALVRSLLNRLSDPYRRLIELRYFEDMSYEDIAQHLDIPLGTVKTQLFRAKDNMYKLLRTPYAQAHLDRSGRVRRKAVPDID